MFYLTVMVPPSVAISLTVITAPKGVMEQVKPTLVFKISTKNRDPFLPFNTLYQLKSLQQSHPQWLEQAHHLLLIPDYFAYRLTGQINHEYTNISTSQMVNLETSDWDDELVSIYKYHAVY